MSLEYCVLEGVGAVANAVTVGQEAMDIDQFVVHIAGCDEDEDDRPSFELRPSARMVWKHLEGRAPRSELYISNNLLRHLVELYVTKRIDRVQLSIQIAVIGENGHGGEAPPDGVPLLGEAGHLHFRRTQCELLSVYTSLTKN